MPFESQGTDCKIPLQILRDILPQKIKEYDERDTIGNAVRSHLGLLELTGCTRRHLNDVYPHLSQKEHEKICDKLQTKSFQDMILKGTRNLFDDSPRHLARRWDVFLDSFLEFMNRNRQSSNIFCFGLSQFLASLLPPEESSTENSLAGPDFLHLTETRVEQVESDTRPTDLHPDVCMNLLSFVFMPQDDDAEETAGASDTDSIPPHITPQIVTSQQRIIEIYQMEILQIAGLPSFRFAPPPLKHLSSNTGAWYLEAEFSHISQGGLSLLCVAIAHVIDKQAAGSLHPELVKAQITALTSIPSSSAFVRAAAYMPFSELEAHEEASHLYSLYYISHELHTRDPEVVFDWSLQSYGGLARQMGDLSRFLVVELEDSDPTETSDGEQKIVAVDTDLESPNDSPPTTQSQASYSGQLHTSTQTQTSQAGQSTSSTQTTDLPILPAQWSPPGLEREDTIEEESTAHGAETPGLLSPGFEPRSSTSFPPDFSRSTQFSKPRDQTGPLGHDQHSGDNEPGICSSPALIKEHVDDDDPLFTELESPQAYNQSRVSDRSMVSAAPLTRPPTPYEDAAESLSAQASEHDFDDNDGKCQAGTQSRQARSPDDKTEPDCYPSPVGLQSPLDPVNDVTSRIANEMKTDREATERVRTELEEAEARLTRRLEESFDQFRVAIMEAFTYEMDNLRTMREGLMTITERQEEHQNRLHRLWMATNNRAREVLGPGSQVPDSGSGATISQITSPQAASSGYLGSVSTFDDTCSRWSSPGSMNISG